MVESTGAETELSLLRWGRFRCRLTIQRHIDLVVERIKAALVDVVHDAER